MLATSVVGIRSYYLEVLGIPSSITHGCKEGGRDSAWTREDSACVAKNLRATELLLQYLEVASTSR